MSRNRFEQILSNLHCNDNTQLPADNRDNLYKLRPLITELNRSFRMLYIPTRKMRVDESMILFRRHSSIKQYNPMKPIKRGYKIWCVVDQKGYVSKFEIYHGKNGELEKEFSIHLETNLHGTEETTVQRTEKNGGKLAVKCPTVVEDYNRHMGDVDHADQLRTTYGLNRKAKKWWHCLFWGFIEMAFINAYCESRGKISTLDFRRSVSQGLITMSETEGKRKSLNPVIKRRKYNYSVSNDVRLGNRGIHWVTKTLKVIGVNIAAFNLDLIVNAVVVPHNYTVTKRKIVIYFTMELICRSKI
nr:unnamed protein product [Callosobruchus analis]